MVLREKRENAFFAFLAIFLAKNREELGMSQYRGKIICICLFSKAIFLAKYRQELTRRLGFSAKIRDAILRVQNASRFATARF